MQTPPSRGFLIANNNTFKEPTPNTDLLVKAKILYFPEREVSKHIKN